MTESPKKSLEDALDGIPVFPLPRVVLFPQAALPLHIFEPRYRVMLQDCLATHGAIAIAHMRPDGRDPSIAEVCGGGLVVEHWPLPDGRSNIVVVGHARLRLEDIALEDLPRFPYRRARATILRDRDTFVSEADRTALVNAATMFASEVKKHDPSFRFEVPVTTDAGKIADSCAFQLVVDAHTRQAILEELCPRERVELVMKQLALQHGAMLRDTPGAVLN